MRLKDVQKPMVNKCCNLNPLICILLIVINLRTVWVNFAIQYISNNKIYDFIALLYNSSITYHLHIFSCSKYYEWVNCLFFERLSALEIFFAIGINSKHLYLLNIKVSQIAINLYYIKVRYFKKWQMYFKT